MAHHGYQVSLVRNEIRSRSQMRDELFTAIEKSQESRTKSKAPENVLKEAIDRFESEVEYDLRHASDEELDLKYFNYFWRGVAYRSSDRVKPIYRASIPFHVWGEG